jgi:hypothetical protein
MADALDPKLLDKRVAPRYLKKGRLDEKDWQKHLQSLPDLEDRAEEVESEFEPTVAPRPPGGPADPQADEE